MNSKMVKSICVVGAGNMGQQISLLAAFHGYRTFCMDINENQLNAARKFVENYLSERIAKNRISKEQATSVNESLIFTPKLEEAAQQSDFVIEAASENIEVKKRLFTELDSLCPPQTILTTNSSYIVSSRIATVTNRPEKVCNMHFFNPALVIKCVEIVKNEYTSKKTIDISMELARSLKKEPVLLHKEIYGFLVNRILTAIRKESLFLFDLGIASFEDIDSAIENALGHPMGPFKLMDLTGIDLTYHVRMERFHETMDPSEAPSPSIVEKYVKGEWGKKTGKGFYNYEE